MATSTNYITSLTPEDIEAASILIQLSKDRYKKQSPKEGAIEDEVASTPILQVSQAHQKPSTKRKKVDKKQQNKKVKNQNMTKISVEEDVSETLMAIQEWFKIELDPRENFHIADVVGQFSKPIKKQLTMSDVTNNQSRLMLSNQLVKEKMLPLLEESEDLYVKEGFAVSVYGPDGKVQEMKFIIWNGGKTPVLTSGWKEFVAKYDLKMHSDFLTIWMFRHRKTRKICFSIDYTRFRINQKLSGKILNPN